MEFHRSDESAPDRADLPGSRLVTPAEVARLLQELIQLGIALTSERDLDSLLERIVAEARRITRAEAATLYLREGDHLRVTVIQNDARPGQRRPRGAPPHPAKADEPRVADHVAHTGMVLNIPDVDDLPTDAPYRFDGRADERLGYRTRSVLAVPLQDPSGSVLGVLELVNALDDSGEPFPFEPGYETIVRALASHAAVAIRNTRLEELSFKDPLTDAYNRRYLKLRIDEEAKRHARFGEPLSLVLLDIDRFKEINDRHGHGAGDRVLREIAELLVTQSRGFTIVTRYGGDEFAVLLANTPRAGALTYALRMRAAIERHAFACGTVTVSIGVANLPDDASSADGLIDRADDALYEAKRLGRNTVCVPPR